MRTRYPAVGDAGLREALSGTRPRGKDNPQNGEPYNTTNAPFWQGVSGTLSSGRPIFNKAYVNGLVTSWS